MTLQRRLQLVGGNNQEQWFAGALKVAFSTSDLKHVDQHFGSAKAFVIYALDQDHSCFIEVTEFDDFAMDGNEDKLVAKINALEDCIAIYTQAIGASAVKQLKLQSIQPLKVSPGTAIDKLIKALQTDLQQGSVTWLARAMEKNQPADASRFDKMEAEGWQE